MENINTNTVTPPDQGDDRPPLWKQILGAVMGGGLALALYYGYEAAKPAVTAYLTLPPVDGGRMYDLGAANIANDDLSDRERKRIVSRNMRAAANIEGTEVDVEAIENNSMDISWPGEEEEPEAEPVAAAVPSLETTDAADAENVMEEDAMEDEDAWESLWSNMREDEAMQEDEETIARSEAPALPDSGFGALIGIAGTAVGAAATRIRRRRGSSAQGV